MKHSSSFKKAPGFTLIELLVTMAIVLILAAIGIGGLQYVTEKKNAELANLQVNLLSTGLEDYKFDYGVYPGGETAGGSDGKSQTNMLFKSLYYGLSPDDVAGTVPNEDDDFNIYIAELDPKNNGQGWIEGSGADATILDPWGNEYRYRVGTQAVNPDFDLWSAGPDGASSTKGTGTEEDADNIGNF